MFSPNIQSQTITIDSTFTQDGEIYPFSPDDTIYGFSVSGKAILLSDTSLVRIILVGEFGEEFMAMEAYPLIVEDSIFSFTNYCDETCFLNELNPVAIKIRLIRSVIEFDSLRISYKSYGNIEDLQYQGKRVKDADKVQMMNLQIAEEGWHWNADTTSIVVKYYYEKKAMFGESYNMLGFDYYAGGYYFNKKMLNVTLDNTSLTKFFDWRQKHDAHIDYSKYWDGDQDIHHFEFGPPITEHNGWMTAVRNQNDCYACVVFSSVASLEAMINLFYNYHVDSTEDLELSESDVYNCTQFNYQYVGCDCDKGKDWMNVLNYVKDDGVVTEACYPWDEPFCDGLYSDCSLNPYKCNDPDTIIKIDNFNWGNLSIQEDKVRFMKELIINKGPLAIAVDSSVFGTDVSHAVCLLGFETDPDDNTIYWIVKNSWGVRWGDAGYVKLALNLNEQINYRLYYLENPYTVPEGLYSRQCYDKDHDGYWNWGIGEKPVNWYPPCDPDDPQEDWNDNNNRIGPCDENYIGQSVQPEMKVYLIPANNIYNRLIKRDEFVSFTMGELFEHSYLKFVIENPGSAQLNLVQYNILNNGKVEIINVPGSSNNFSIYTLPSKSICMGSASEFGVNFSGNQQGELTMIKIYVNEPDIEDFQFIIVLNECHPATELEPVPVNTYWEGYQLKTKDYHVQTGVTLTVTGQIAMAEEADIFVDRGAKIVIDGGRLTGTCNELWNGIDLWGDVRDYQVPAYQGTAEIINGGMIEFADTAIATERKNGIYIGPSGGIINCNNAILKDNYVSICLLPYTNPQGPNIPNFCRFKKSEFKITNDYYDLDDLISTAPKCAIHMDGIKGLVIEGCRFINESSADKRSRGSGIINMNAGYFIKSACENESIYPCNYFIPCRFEGWDYGIKSLNEWSSKTLMIDSADFIDNYRGIYMSMTSDATVIRNRFELNADDDYFSPGDTLIGIYTEQCNRYFIEENKISGANPADYKLAGMHILNSRPYYNEIYNDSLINLTYGIIAAGENRDEQGIGLCIKCNDFIDCATDVLVTPRMDENGNPIILKYTGIAINQGLFGSQAPPGVNPNTMGAGNTFTLNAFPALYNNFYNDPKLDLINYTHQPNTPRNKLRPFPVNNVTRFEDGFVNYSKDTSCPSHLNNGGIEIQLEKINLSDNYDFIIAYKDTLDEYIDGGNTPGLNFEIHTTIPDEAFILRQELLDESPYLSDTVIKSAIAKEDVLVNAMIRDVLVANPQSSKSADIITALENKFEPMPDYMMAEIMEGINILAGKEQLERELALHASIKARSFSNIIRYYKNDTINTTANDSIAAFIEADSDLETRYQLAFHYLFSGDTIDALNTLTSVPTDFLLDENQLTEHSFYEDLFEILSDLQSDSTGIDSLSLSILITLSTESDELPGIFAHNFLINKGLVQYFEPVYLPSNLKKSPTWDDKEKPDLPHAIYLRVFPNPSISFFILEYDLRNITGRTTIKISNILGKELMEFDLQEGQDQKIIPTKSFSNGTYLIRLLINNHLSEIHKLNIVR